MSNAQEWFAILVPSKKKGGGPKKEVGPLTHREAREVARTWYADGASVELQRRRHYEKAYTVTPVFPGIDKKRQKAS